MYSIEPTLVFARDMRKRLNDLASDLHVRSIRRFAVPAVCDRQTAGGGKKIFYREDGRSPPRAV
jgi:hypothetical protein